MQLQGFQVDPNTFTFIFLYVSDESICWQMFPDLWILKLCSEWCYFFAVHIRYRYHPTAPMFNKEERTQWKSVLEKLIGCDMHARCLLKLKLCSLFTYSPVFPVASFLTIFSIVIVVLFRRFLTILLCYIAVFSCLNWNFSWCWLLIVSLPCPYRIMTVPFSDRDNTVTLPCAVVPCWYRVPR